MLFYDAFGVAQHQARRSEAVCVGKFEAKRGQSNDSPTDFGFRKDFIWCDSDPTL